MTETAQVKHNPCQCLKCQKKRRNKEIEVFWYVHARLEKASQGCEELDLPLFGQILLRKLEELDEDDWFAVFTLQTLKKYLQKIRDCEKSPDRNIELAKENCKKLLDDNHY
jgi:hypothetical protein